MIYLDHNATTPVLPEVFEAMRPYFCEEWGNPSSAYKFGSKLKGVIETARAQVAELMGARPREIIFTSCATESNNATIHAALKANPGKRHNVTSAVEHSAVLNYCMALEKEGYRVTYLPVDRDGMLKLANLVNAVTDETAVVSLRSFRLPLRPSGPTMPADDNGPVIIPPLDLYGKRALVS
jgi:cysteine desulfurase